MRATRGFLTSSTVGGHEFLALIPSPGTTVRSQSSNKLVGYQEHHYRLACEQAGTDDRYTGLDDVPFPKRNSVPYSSISSRDG